jgi:hypothetical protein
MIESLVKELGIRCIYTVGKETKQQAQAKYKMLEARIRADERRRVLQELSVKTLPVQTTDAADNPLSAQTRK